VVEMWGGVLKGLHSPREEEKGKDPWSRRQSNDEQFAQKQKEICHFDEPDHIPHEQEEGVSGGRAEVFAIYRHLVAKSEKKLDAFLQAPKAALETAHEESGTLIVEKMHGEEEKKKNTPERSAKRRKYGEGRHVVWLDKSPIVRGKGPRQSHLPQRRDKVGTPKEEKDVVELQANQVFVVNSLAAVEGKKALRVRALRLHGCGRVVLQERTHHMSNRPANTT
uniref:Uncharacterized protein n=1 Tax=Hippocampus comes TaxID=109280 RepID=A0A3Q2ZM91_HIPCM